MGSLVACSLCCTTSKGKVPKSNNKALREESVLNLDRYHVTLRPLLTRRAVSRPTHGQCLANCLSSTFCSCIASSNSCWQSCGKVLVKNTVRTGSLGCGGAPARSFLRYSPAAVNVRWHSSTTTRSSSPRTRRSAAHCKKSSLEVVSRSTTVSWRGLCAVNSIRLIY